MMRTFPLFLLMSALVVGCGAAPPPQPAAPAPVAPAPAPAPLAIPPSPAPAPLAPAAPTPAKKPTGIDVMMPSGWHHDASGAHMISYVNKAEDASVAFVLIPSSEKDRLQAVQALRDKVMQRPNIKAKPVVSIHGVVLWTFTHQLDDGRVIKGVVLAKGSNMPGYGIMLLGGWPDAKTKKILPEFLRMAETVKLR